MEALNQGPYAKLLPLNNGRYKRIVDPVPPKIFLDCQACCNCDLNKEELDLTSILSQQSYDKDEAFMSKNYDNEIHESSNSTAYTKLYTPQLADESQSTYSRELSFDSENTPSRVCSLNSENSSILELSETSEILKDLQSHEERYEREAVEHEDANNHKHSMVMRGGAGGIMEQTNWNKQERPFKETSEDGIPILFYTKNRPKPALLTMAVDHKMQVIYMKRNKATRFFPIKLIDKIITSHQIIEEEFSKQIKHDPTTRVNNMVLFNASNFTECVAIQFAEHSEKIKFINEVYRIKDLIKHGY